VPRDQHATRIRHAAQLAPTDIVGIDERALERRGDDVFRKARGGEHVGIDGDIGCGDIESGFLWNGGAWLAACREEQGAEQCGAGSEGHGEKVRWGG
jgi:hypothetical protein